MKRFAIALGLAAVLATPAIAAPESTDIVRVELDFERSDFATEAGTRKAYRLLRIKANRACRVPTGLRATGYDLDLDCRDALVDSAVARINAPRLNALHAPYKAEMKLAAKDD